MRILTTILGSIENPMHIPVSEHRPHALGILFVSVCRLCKVKPAVVPPRVRVNCRGSLCCRDIRSTKQYTLSIVSLDPQDTDTFHTFHSRTGQLRDDTFSTRES